jgi:N-acetylglucosaminyl-diphospho-decaprenol L-rhamnosyltransferase
MMTSECPDISIIFVNYRSVESLERAVLSLRSAKEETGVLEVIIANNDSDEVDLVQKLAGRLGIQVLFLPENRGFANAANAAASKARGEIIGFLNPDTEFLSGSLAYISRFFRVHSEVGVVGSRLVSDYGEPEAWSAGRAFSIARLFRNKTPLFMGKRYWDALRPIAVDWVSGGALFIRRSLYRDLEGFDERYFLYFEDMDLCVRSRLAGFRTVLVPSVVFRHKGGASFHSDGDKKRFYYASQDRYFSYHRPSWEGMLLRVIRERILRI